MNIEGTSNITVWIGFERNGEPVYKQASLKCLVGGISHNIISTTTLCKPHLVLKGQSADGVRSRRGQFKRITALAEAVWDSIAVVSLWICIDFHLHCIHLGSLNCLAFHCALPLWWIYNFAFSWIDFVSGFGATCCNRPLAFDLLPCHFR